MTVSELKAMYINEQKYRNNAERTIEWYNVSLDEFIKWLPSDDVSQLTLKTFKSYVIYYNSKRKSNGEPYKSATVNTRVRALRAFYNFCIEEEFIDDFSRRLHATKILHEEKQILDDSEIEKLMLFCSKSLQSFRNKCIITMMLDCGLRRGEISKIKIKDVDFANDCILVNGKGRKQRYAPIGKASHELLKQYKSKYRARADPDASFFISQTGKPITDNAVKQMFQDLKKETGIERLHPHLLRHTFATQYLIDGGDLETLRLILGHSDLHVTQVYLHMASSYKIIHSKHISHIDKLNAEQYQKHLN